MFTRTPIALTLLAVTLAFAAHGAADSPPAPAPAPPVAVVPFPAGWEPAAQRDEIRPAFAFDPAGGPKQRGAFVITAADSVSQHGRVQKAFPVTGGKFYRFEASRKTEGVATPRRSAPVRVVWQDAQGKAVRAEPPAGREKEPGSNMLAEPEHPLDGPTDKAGWTKVEGLYLAPPKATQAVVELHLQWAPRARAIWSEVSLEEAAAPASRKVRLATIHHYPSGKSPRANREEYAPLLTEAAKQKADLVVIGETVPYVRLGKKPHETAEAVPGPTTEYFGEQAKTHNLHIVATLYERDGPAVFNVAVLIGPDGKVIGKYRKVCLPHSEVEAGIAPGDDYPVFDTKLGKIGMMVCYDGFFPEVARELTNRGAEVIAWPVWGCDPLLAKARANENRVVIVSSTYSEPSRNWMLSAVYERDGRPLAVAEKWDQVVVAEVDLSKPHAGPYNLGVFHDMVQRHRPPVVGAK